MKRLLGLLIICLKCNYSHGFATRRKELRPRSQPRADSNINFQNIIQTSCRTPHDLLLNVCQKLTTKNDPKARVASLAMVRLSKMLISQSNSQYEPHSSFQNLNSEWFAEGNQYRAAFTCMGQVLSQAIRNSSTRKDHDITVEGTKAAGVISRIYSLHGITDDEYVQTFRAIASSFQNIPVESVKTMESHHLSGIKWAFDCLGLADDRIRLSDLISDAYEDLELPFRIRPGFMLTGAETENEEEDERLMLTLDNLMSQVDFLRDEIKTTSTGKVVRERRKTAWQGDEHVAGFAYSGKVMETKPFSPVVKHVRNKLHMQTNIYYDCCLLNLYPDGDSGMRYHSDPDQGSLWGYDTSVVSVGASRRFAFRDFSDGSEMDKKTSGQPHMFVVMDGDVTEMRKDCQFKYQHAVKAAEGGNEKAPRSSLVFKQSL